MKYRWIIIDIDSFVHGTNDAGVAQDYHNFGDCIVVDCLKGEEFVDDARAEISEALYLYNQEDDDENLFDEESPAVNKAVQVDPAEDTPEDER